jgi:hypothetical protein
VTPDVYRPSLLKRPHRLDAPARKGSDLSTDPLLNRPDRGHSYGRRLRAAKRDVLSLTRFPDFLQRGRARVVKRSVTRFPDVQRVLGAQATVATGGGEGGALSFGRLPVVALSLVLLSSLLLVGALLPAPVIARMPVSPAFFVRIREPLALAAVGILSALAVVSLVAALG